MSNPYSTTFTLVSGATTITLNVRPDKILWDDQVMITRQGIPGSNQAAWQHLGYAGIMCEFEVEIWNITSITQLPAAANAEDIVMTLRSWHRLGSTVSVTTDHILEMNANAALSMKISEMTRNEIAGTPHLYTVRLLLTEFNAGDKL